MSREPGRHAKCIRPAKISRSGLQFFLRYFCATCTGARMPRLAVMSMVLLFHRTDVFIAQTWAPQTSVVGLSWRAKPGLLHRCRLLPGQRAFVRCRPSSRAACGPQRAWAGAGRGSECSAPGNAGGVGVTNWYHASDIPSDACFKPSVKNWSKNETASGPALWIDLSLRILLRRSPRSNRPCTLAFRTLSRTSATGLV